MSDFVVIVHDRNNIISVYVQDHDVSFLSVDISEIRDDRMCPVCGDHLITEVSVNRTVDRCIGCDFTWTNAKFEDIAKLARRK